MAQGTIDYQGDWVKLCELPDRVRATLAQDLLASGDIESMLVDQTDSMYPMIGTVSLYVRAGDRECAQQLLEGFQH